MARVQILLSVVLAAFIVAALGQESFKASFQVRRPDQNGGFVSGLISYSKAELSIRYDFVDRNYTEIQRFHQNYSIDDREKFNQWQYQIGATCDGNCRASKIPYPFPLYYLGSHWVASNAQPQYNGCDHYEPDSITNVDSNVTNIWFRSTGEICRAVWVDGADYIFDAVTTPATFGTTYFLEPQDCRCTDAIDIIILIDRSGSQGTKNYLEAKMTARDFTRFFELSPSQTNVLIAQFDVDVELIMDLYEGVSDANVDAAIANMDCACDGTLEYENGAYWNEDSPGNGDGDLCCPRRTSHSKAILRASEFFTTNGRENSTKIILVVSDGKYNTMADGTPCKTGKQCADDLEAAIITLAQTHIGVMVFGIGCGNTDHLKMGSIVGGRFERLTDTRTYWREKTHYIVGAAGCGEITNYCNPATCCGLCECGNCMAPTACDEGDFCNPTAIYQGRCCHSQIRNCTHPTDMCIDSFCNSTAQQCQYSAVTCPEGMDPAQEVCWERVCNPTTGACESFPTDFDAEFCLAEECTNSSQCDDGNVCTRDTCSGALGSRSCSWAPEQCDDGNQCTYDACIAPTIGCVNTSIESSYCDDGVECTSDRCDGLFGCQHSILPCNDGVECTSDACDEVLGRCVYDPKICPNSNDNCTLNYCMIGHCDSRTLCLDNIQQAGELAPGYIVVISFGVLIAVAALGVGGYAAWKIFLAEKLTPSGGKAEDYAVD